MSKQSLRLAREYTGPRNGLALGGGGLWGVFAHEGLLQFLYENRIQIHAIAGVSGGALSGAIASAFINQDGLVDADGLEYMGRVRQEIRCVDDFTEVARRSIIGQESLRLAVHTVLKAGGSKGYERMMDTGPTVPFFAQVQKHDFFKNESEVFLEASPGDGMKDVLQFAAASAANKRMFGFDPIRIDGIAYSDDVTTTFRSVAACVSKLRDEFADIRVIGSRVAMGDGYAWIRKILDWWYTGKEERADVEIFPKEGHQIFDGSASLTNWKKGWTLPCMGRKYAHTMEDLQYLPARRIAIPGLDFANAGYEAAVRQKAALLRLKIE